MKRILKTIKIFLLVFVIPPCLYLLAAIVGIVIPVNAEAVNDRGDKTIFFVSNKYHVDIAVPVKTSVINWKNIVKPVHIPGNVENFKFISFGWGDEEFYRNTPQWEDLKVKTALTALFLNSPSAMHITYYRDLQETEDIIAVQVTRQQYERLTEYFLNTFKFNSAGETHPIPNLHYTNYDAFYPARGSFHLFRTCNTWVNNALKYAEMEGCLWTPFKAGIFYRYR